MGKGNVLLIKGISQYNAMRNYIDEIEQGFRLAGYNTYVLDALEKSHMFQLQELLNCEKIDITFVCNVILERAIGGALYMTYLTDHPAAHRERLEKLNDRSVVFVCDKGHEAYVRRYCPNIKYVKYIPLSGEASKRFIPYNDRSRDIVFTGSYCKPEKSYGDIISIFDGILREIAEYTAEYMLKHSEKDLESCLQNALSRFELEVSQSKFHELMDGFMLVDAYVRNYYRDKMIRKLVESGLQVHVFGRGWEEFDGSGKENLRIEKGNDYVARKAVADAKISINIMPWFKEGFQERIAAAMLSGTVALTDESKYIQENFKDGSEIVLYSLDNLEELPVKVKWLLNHQEEAERIALAGKERAEKGMTWQHRTFEMLQYMEECVLLPVTQAEKYGDILQIRYRTLHNRQMMSDAINNMNEIIDMVSQVKLYDKMELCDIDFFYTKFLMYFVKINANFPEINFSEFIYNYIMNLTEEQVNEGTELLLLECMHMLAIFLAIENQELKSGGNLV